MKERYIWMRLGVTLKATKEEIECLFSDDYEVSRQALKDILEADKFYFGGDSYIPESQVEFYNETYGTNHKVGDYEFNL